MSEFVHSLRVRYHECDPQGIVFNANYATYVDVGLTEMWREVFGSYQSVVQEHGVELVVGSLTLDFKASAHPDDVIDVGLQVTHIGTTSMATAIDIRSEERTLVTGSIRHVCVDPRQMTKTAVPAAVRTALRPVTG